MVRIKLIKVKKINKTTKSKKNYFNVYIMRKFVMRMKNSFAQLQKFINANLF